MLSSIKEDLKDRKSTSQRTKEYWEERGYCVENVEKRVPHKRNVTKDFGGFADLIAYDEKGDTIGIQATTIEHITHRMDKINNLYQESGYGKIWTWLKGDRRVIVQGWSIRGRGEAKEWHTKMMELTIGPEVLEWHEIGT